MLAKIALWGIIGFILGGILLEVAATMLGHREDKDHFYE